MKKVLLFAMVAMLAFTSTAALALEIDFAEAANDTSPIALNVSNGITQVSSFVATEIAQVVFNPIPTIPIVGLYGQLMLESPGVASDVCLAYGTGNAGNVTVTFVSDTWAAPTPAGVNIGNGTIIHNFADAVTAYVGSIKPEPAFLEPTPAMSVDLLEFTPPNTPDFLDIHGFSDAPEAPIPGSLLLLGTGLLGLVGLRRRS